MVLRKTLLSCAALTLMTGMALSTAQAQTQLSFLGGVFNFDGTSFTNAGGASGTATTFSFVDNAGTTIDLNGQNVTASIVLSGTVSGAATEVTVGSTSFIQQSLTGVTEKIIANGSGGFTAGTTLIAVSSTDATLSGTGHNLTFSLAGSGLFSSNYFSVGGPGSQTMLLSTNNALSVTGTTSTSGGISVTTGTLGAFTGTAYSNVFNSSSVPEASTLMGLGGLVLGGGFLSLRRRKA
jgi:hypothetical protein